MSRSRSGSPRSFENERNQSMGGGRGGGGFGGGGFGGIPRSEDLFSIKVDNMSLRTNKDDVRAKFERFGEIGDIFFPSDKMTGSSRGFCFVRYFKEESKEDALDYYKDGFELDDRKVVVEPASARPRPGMEGWDPDRRGRNRDNFRNDSFGGRGGGGFGGRGGFGGGSGRSRAEDMFSLKCVDLSLRTTKDDVRAKFDRFGEIGDIFFPPDRETGASRGFCYVRYFKRDDLEDAMDACRDGIEIDGQRVHIERAQPRGTTFGAGGRGGGFDRFNDRGGRDFGRDDRRLDRFDERDRYDDRRRSRSPRRRSPSPYGRRRSRSPPRRRDSPDDRYKRRRSPSPDYDRYRRRSPLDRRSRSPYRR